MQDLEKGTIPDDERPVKLKKLCKLCGKHKLIPDSMRLQAYGNGDVEIKEFNGPYSVYQGELKGGKGKVAIKVIRLYVPQKLDEPISVSVVTCTHPL